MNIDVLVACIAAAASIIGVIIASVCTTRKANQDILTKLETSQSLMEEKIENLTKEVEKHNQVIERMYTAEEKISTLEREMGEVRSTIGLKGSDKT